jgi:predicted dehydrogenase
MTPEPLRVGVLGCGNISDAYLSRAPEFADLEVVACADRDADRAAAQAAKYGVRAMAPDDLLADAEIGLVVNLTPPLAHFEVGLAALEAGKHLYAEKPLAVTLEEARGLSGAAEAAGLRLGSAPDTFLGGGHQNARRLLDEGAIGRPIAGTICFATHGMEHWHPDPAFFFRRGGGPVLDMGAYYVGALVNLIGPVTHVTAMAGRGYADRLVTSEGPRTGQRLPVEVDTHVSGALEFACGAIVTIVMSWDVWVETPFRLELYGESGTMVLPDPNFFGGATRVSRNGGPFETIEPEGLPYARPNRVTTRGTDVADYRIIGVADMAQAIREGRPHRCSGDLALHVLEVLTALERSAREGAHVSIVSRCERPSPLETPFLGGAA